MIQDFYEDFEKLTIAETLDGVGGTIETEGKPVPFRAAITRNLNAESFPANQDGITRRFNIFHSPADISLMFGDKIRRKSSGEIYRVTSNSADKRTPAFSKLNLCYVSAEVVNP